LRVQGLSTLVTIRRAVQVVFVDSTVAVVVIPVARVCLGGVNVWLVVVAVVAAVDLPSAWIGIERFRTTPSIFILIGATERVRVAVFVMA